LRTALIKECKWSYPVKILPLTLLFVDWKTFFIKTVFLNENIWEQFCKRLLNKNIIKFFANSHVLLLVLWKSVKSQMAESQFYHKFVLMNLHFYQKICSVECPFLPKICSVESTYKHPSFCRHPLTPFTPLIPFNPFFPLN